MFGHGRVSLPPRVWQSALVAALAFGIGSATVAFGLVVNGVVFACSHNATGALRLELADKPCNTEAANRLLRETRISWNEVGQQGLQGIQGPRGEKGDNGDQGIQGIQGEPGQEGDKGDQGIQGTQGLKGDPGATGPMGPQGIQGLQGEKGDTGEKGLAGRGLLQATTNYSTGSVTTTPLMNLPDRTYALVPGLSRTITFSEDALVYVVTDGRAESDHGEGTIAIAMVIDGVVRRSQSLWILPDNEGWNTFNGNGNWSFSDTYVVSAGTHTFQIRASHVDGVAMYAKSGIMTTLAFPR